MSSYAKQHDVGSLVKNAVGTIPKAAGAAETIVGPAIDRDGYLSCKLTVSVGAAAGSPTAQSVAAKLTHSATSGGSYVDVTGGAITAITADDSSAFVDIKLGGLNRYLKVSLTSTLTAGTTPTIPVASIVTLGGASVVPAA